MIFIPVLVFVWTLFCLGWFCWNRLSEPIIEALRRQAGFYTTFIGIFS